MKQISEQAIKMISGLTKKVFDLGKLKVCRCSEIPALESKVGELEREVKQAKQWHKNSVTDSNEYRTVLADNDELQAELTQLRGTLKEDSKSLNKTLLALRDCQKELNDLREDGWKMVKASESDDKQDWMDALFDLEQALGDKEEVCEGGHGDDWLGFCLTNCRKICLDCGKEIKEGG